MKPEEFRQYQEDFERRLEAAGVAPNLVSGLFAYLTDGRTPEEAEEDAVKILSTVWGARLPTLEEAIDRWQAVEDAVTQEARDLADSGEKVVAPLFTPAVEQDLFFERERLAQEARKYFLDGHPDHKYLRWDTEGVWFVDPNGNAGVWRWTEVERRLEA